MYGCEISCTNHCIGVGSWRTNDLELCTHTQHAHTSSLNCNQHSLFAASFLVKWDDSARYAHIWRFIDQEIYKLEKWKTVELAGGSSYELSSRHYGPTVCVYMSFCFNAWCCQRSIYRYSSIFMDATIYQAQKSARVLTLLYSNSRALVPPSSWRENHFLRTIQVWACRGCLSLFVTEGIFEPMKWMHALV